MKRIHHIYINGQFVTPHGTQVQELINPTTGQPRASVVLGDETDVDAAVAAARAAYPAYSRTSKQERIAILRRLHQAVAARSEELVQVMVEEYGGTLAFCRASVQRSANCFLQTSQLLETFDFVRTAGSARVVLEPLGVVGIITPWNSSYGFICSKLATALAAGSTAVIKPSELSATQTQLLTECLHAAQIPAGLFNIVNGTGDTVGAAITAHRDIAKISFTGSTAVGKRIARGAVDTLKRVTLELGGKSPNLLLDDADLELAIPIAVAAFTFNSGQACLAGTRLIVPASRLEEIQRRIKTAVEALQVGDPADAGTQIGPLVNAAQYARVQRYIALGLEEGATLLTGGAGHPPGLEHGYFVRPTVFVNVRNDMAIAQEEIFGPVLSIIACDSEEEAIAIANDTRYGLQAYVSSGDLARANRVAAQLVAGRVFINGLYDEPLAPFGGFKQSGIGREFGTYGLEAYLEPKAMMGYSANDETP